VSTETHHPNEMQYVKVAALLAFLTAIEVAVYYIPTMKPLLRPVLAAMMASKFFLVGAYFMHLKFDSKIFRRLFIMGIILAMIVFGVALWTFTYAVLDPGARA
jgi:cytochrome c oxidase subunit IV